MCNTAPQSSVASSSFPDSHDIVDNGGASYTLPNMTKDDDPESGILLTHHNTESETDGTVDLGKPLAHRRQIFRIHGPKGYNNARLTTSNVELNTA